MARNVQMNIYEYMMGGPYDSGPGAALACWICKIQGSKTGHGVEEVRGKMYTPQKGHDLTYDTYNG